MKAGGRAPVGIGFWGCRMPFPTSRMNWPSGRWPIGRRRYVEEVRRLLEAGFAVMGRTENLDPRVSDIVRTLGAVEPGLLSTLPRQGRVLPRAARRRSSPARRDDRPSHEPSGRRRRAGAGVDRSGVRPGAGSRSRGGDAAVRAQRRAARRTVPRGRPAIADRDWSRRSRRSWATRTRTRSTTWSWDR